MVMSRKLLLT